MHVILLARVVWAAAKDAEVIEKAWTATMMARNSQVEMVICCGGDTEVLGVTTSTGAVLLGVEGSGGGEEVKAMGNGVVVAGAGTEDYGA